MPQTSVRQNKKNAKPASPRELYLAITTNKTNTLLQPQPNSKLGFPRTKLARHSANPTHNKNQPTRQHALSKRFRRTEKRQLKRCKTSSRTLAERSLRSKCRCVPTMTLQDQPCGKDSTLQSCPSSISHGDPPSPTCVSKTSARQPDIKAERRRNGRWGQNHNNQSRPWFFTFVTLQKRHPRGID